MRHRWRGFWLSRSGLGYFGRLASRLACWGTAPYHARAFLAKRRPNGFVDPKAELGHPELELGKECYLGQGVTVLRGNESGGRVEIGPRAAIYGDTFIQCGDGGGVVLGEESHVQPGCHFRAYVSDIVVGKKVEIAASCAFYSFSHGVAAGIPIMEQPLESKGPIVIKDGAWLGHGVTVLQGVTIGEGAVVGAGSLVNRDIPPNAIAVGSPAKVIAYRGESEGDA